MPQQPSHRAVAGLSRRKALITGASVAAGSAIAVTSSRLLTQGDADAAMPAASNPDVPVMLRLTDARRGAFDVYVGTNVVHMVDNRFAAQVAQAASKSGH